MTGDCRASLCGNRGVLGLWESGQHTMMSYADDVRLYPPADYGEQSPAPIRGIVIITSRGCRAAVVVGCWLTKQVAV